MRYKPCWLALLVLAATLEIASAQTKAWSVFSNCNVRPCQIGVALEDWYAPGWSRIASFWNEYLAWKHACWLHHVERAHYSPDIANGIIDCSKFN
jgi:hypothetical protein